jgi:hypothetical protein
LRIMAFALTLLGACSSMGWDPADHHVVLEPSSSEDVEISQVHICTATKGVMVFGELSPRHITQEIPAGHVNIKLVARDGVTLVEKSVSYCRIGKLFKKPQRYSFSAAIPILPPAGSAIRLRFEGTP